MKTLKHNLLAIALMVVAITPSLAGTITIYGTGATNSGSGQQDPNYELISAPGGVSAPIQAYTTTNYSAWLPPPTGLWWDNPFDPLAYGPGGNYDYRTTFDLTGFNPTTAVLTGRSGVDDAGEIYLNGTAVAPMGSIAAFAPFNITDGLNGAHFVPGVNHLDFLVYNTLLLQQSPTGLVVEISGTASTTPEPGTLALLGSGVLGLGGMLRRRLRA